MGARIEADQDRAAADDHRADRSRPLITRPPVPSAQVKSAVLLAGIQTEGTTTVREASPDRDHTELALRAFGASIDTSV